MDIIHAVDEYLAAARKLADAERAELPDGGDVDVAELFKRRLFALPRKFR
jgi:hypothetical protein